MMTLLKSSLESLPLIHQGKVRDIYDIDQRKMLIVTTDRLSAFDVIMGEPIPYKGEVLTRMANFWFDYFKDIPNHLTHENPEDYVLPDEIRQVKGRAIVVKKLIPIPIEAIVRGYIIGSGWKEYQLSQTICGIGLPEGLKQADRLPQVLFTPSNKAEQGQHDENITLDQCRKLIGDDLTQKVSDISIEIYSKAAALAKAKGIIIADTKFEFGLDSDNQVTLMDEVLTPDSSRFWPEESYQVGVSPPSFDKQYVRDWLESQTWNKKAPAPKLPKNVIDETSQKYIEVFFKITGKGLS
ncbi:MAG: phosphoribosylaminoimidazolesuccinocarboxamide synthase [Methylophilaceae bacterium]|nr:phosphoribosylaminoimidazolesuccinocarboxamide synthase [Methylophilaceae bacterium]MBL6791566.1 phosphoribosylaminoimidazolesuccinocarboxamide synthase [Methylophilaceae bacterium]